MTEKIDINKLLDFDINNNNKNSNKNNKNLRVSISANQSPVNSESEEEIDCLTFTPKIKPKKQVRVVSPLNLDSARTSFNFFGRKQSSLRTKGFSLNSFKKFRDSNNESIDLVKIHSQSLKVINVEETINKLQERLKDRQENCKRSCAMEIRAKKTNVFNFMENKKIKKTNNDVIKSYDINHKSLEI